MARSAAATIEAFIHERSLAVQALGQPRPREAWRQLRYVVAQARRWAEPGDQKRFMTPCQAVEAGADYIGIGRPIVAHRNPQEALKKILQELG